MFSFIRYCLRRIRGFQAEAFGIFRTDLSSLMVLGESCQTLDEKISWLESLLDWIRIPLAPDQNSNIAHIEIIRVKFLLQALERSPHWKKTITKNIASILLETEPASLFCETGLNTEDGFFSEASERILKKIIPTPKNEKDLSELFSRLFISESDADWLDGLDEKLLNQLMALIFEDARIQEALTKKYQLALAESLIILSSKIEALGLLGEIRLRSQVVSVRESAFYRLRMKVSSAIEAADAVYDDFLPLLVSCREEISSAFAHLEEHGVSLAIVYKLERMELQLKRIEALMSILFGAPESTPKKQAWIRLLSDLVRSSLQNDRIGALIQQNLHMLSRKIVERAGISGHHYITSNKKEYFLMLLSAAGGGVLTAATAHLKYLSGGISSALFVTGFFSWIIYSGSFILMQIFHLTLATKQPSMTAPALAAKLKESQDYKEFADLVTKITRSQFAAAIGNIGMVIPTAMLADYLYFLQSGSHLMSKEFATKTISSMDPTQSLTIIYAALTGVILWLSSIGAGWIENWFVYRRLPEAISHSSWIGNTLGKRLAAKISAWVCNNISGLGGNLCLGFLLAFTPIGGKFFGLPLDVRHVTLSAGALTFAYCSLGEFTWQELAVSGVSVIIIGIMNFGVSFVAALYTAAKAREVKSSRLQLLQSAVWEKMKKNPLSFLFPETR